MQRTFGDNVIDLRDFVIRFTTWNDARFHCESENKTLLQYNAENSEIGLQMATYLDAYTKASLMFLGLKRNAQVMYQHYIFVFVNCHRIKTGRNRIL